MHATVYIHISTKGSDRSLYRLHFIVSESEANKVQQPRQILLKVSTLGLATEKYIQIAVVLVSAQCSPDHEEYAKNCVFRAS